MKTCDTTVTRGDLTKRNNLTNQTFTKMKDTVMCITYKLTTKKNLYAEKGLILKPRFYSAPPQIFKIKRVTSASSPTHPFWL